VGRSAAAGDYVCVQELLITWAGSQASQQAGVQPSAVWTVCFVQLVVCDLLDFQMYVMSRGREGIQRGRKGKAPNLMC
jgi:hypothetical protein